MKKTLEILFLLFILLISPTYLYSQQERLSVDASGKYFSNSDLVFYYDIGDLYVEILNNTTSMSFTQGFIQPPDINQSVKIEEKSKTADFFLFPNPVHDFLNIAFNEIDVQGMYFTLVDACGKEIPLKLDTQSSYNTSTTACFSICDIAVGSYIIRCIDKKSNKYYVIKFIKT